MGERKVLNKYYPPDFDPSKIPKRIALKNDQMKVRMMLPMSVRCKTCGSYMYKGTKFNCRMEDVKDDTYLGIKKFRFYFKCTKCSAELIMKTDPQNSDYEMEAGGTRNFEPWREADEAKEAAKKQREQEEMGDAMKALENRTLDSRMEMDILSALDEMKSMRARQAALDPTQVLSALQRAAEGSSEASVGPTSLELTEEDERLIKSIVFRNSEKYVKRIEDDEEEDEEDNGQKEPKRRKVTETQGGASDGLGSEAFKPEERNFVAERAQGKTKVSDKWAEDRAPVFELKPVKVGFTVKSKPKTGSATANHKESNPQGTSSKEESGLKAAAVGSVNEGAANGGKEATGRGEGRAGGGEGAGGEGNRTTLAGLSSLYGDDDSE